MYTLCISKYIYNLLYLFICIYVYDNLVWLCKRCRHTCASGEAKRCMVVTSLGNWRMQPSITGCRRYGDEWGYPCPASGHSCVPGVWSRDAELYIHEYGFVGAGFESLPTSEQVLDMQAKGFTLRVIGWCTGNKSLSGIETGAHYNWKSSRVYNRGLAGTMDINIKS